MSEPKITVLPQAEQDVFFQEKQFDDSLGGTNPIAYWRGQTPDDKKNPISKGANKAKQSQLKKAEKELEGHENKEEILKVLRGDQ